MKAVKIKEGQTYEWISWETSTHYCISKWDGDTIKNKWINK